MSGHNRGKIKTRYYYLIALAVVVLDQLSKHLITSRMMFESSVPVIWNVFHITLVRNSGGAFGLFQSWAGLLTLITAAAIIVIVVLIRRRVQLPVMIGIALALQLGGAVGNLIDRIRFHYVVDFIDFRVWPVFNLADSAITAGILLLAWYVIFHERRNADPAIEEK